MAAALDLLESEHEVREAHGHLMRECPWYQHVDQGGRDHPDLHCRPATGEPRGLHEGGALVKFAMDPQPPLTRDEAQYRLAGTAERRCGTCLMHHGDHCSLVEGTVSGERGVCAHWRWDDPDLQLTPRTPEASTVVKPTVPPGGPGLFHMKGHHLPPYIEHLYPHLVERYGKHDAYGVAVGIVKKWAAGINPGGWKTKSGKGKRTHPDVRAAAARNVAQWEQERAEAHRHGEAQGHAADTDTWTVALAAKATAPGARPFFVPPTPGAHYSQYGMYQNPVQAISPSPPLPPLTELPTAAEVRAVIPLVPECSDASLSATARKFLEQAAGKLEKDDPLQALVMMRSAQTALYAAHKADQRELIPSAYTANVFTAVPPAAQSSATSAMKQGQAKQLAWRKAEQALGALSDRIRKRYFHGVFNGPSQMARFTEDRDMTALDRVLALAVVTGHDVSEPSESDTSGATPLIQPPEGLLDITDANAARELAALPLLDKAKVNAYLDQARKMAGTNRSGASQAALRASVIAHEAGARDLARHIRAHVRALAEMGNLTNPRDAAARMEAGGKSVSPVNSPQTVADTGNGPMHLSAVERLELAAAAGKSAGVTAGHSTGAAPHPAPTYSGSAHPPKGHPTPLSEHLHHLHELHLAHLHRLHELHLEHMRTHPAAPKKATAGAATPGPRSSTAGAPTHGTQVTVG